MPRSSGTLHELSGKPREESWAASLQDANTGQRLPKKKKAIALDDPESWTENP
jgi:hypothetical protein